MTGRSLRRAGGALLALAGVALAAVVAMQFDAVRAAYVRWRHPRVVVVTFDTLHVGYTGAYNPANADLTPHLDKFAAEGVLFEHAYTTVPITLPSHTALFTGQAPAATGVMLNGDQVPDRLTTLAEVFREHGYHTAGFVSLGVLRRDFGIAQGFDHYDDDQQERHARWYRTADEIVDAAVAWLDQVGDEPFFLWVHLSDPHEPYLVKGAPPDARLALDGEALGDWSLESKVAHRLDLRLTPGPHTLTWTALRPPDKTPDHLVVKLLHTEKSLATVLPDPEASGVHAYHPLLPSWSLPLVNDGPRDADVRLWFRGALRRPSVAHVRDQYRAEVAYADRHLGQLRAELERRGLESSTTWLLTSDHGEGLFHHDKLGHAGYAYEDQLRVLWILKGPGLPAARRIGGGPVLVEDMAPSLLDAIGLDGALPAHGRSRRTCWTGAGECAGQPEFWAYGVSHEQRLGSLAGYRWPFKAIWHHGRTRAHRLDEDADERNDLLRADGDDPPRELAALTGELGERLPEFVDLLENRAERALDDEQTEMLRGLGYLE